MKVYCLIGTSGAGKTSVLGRLEMPDINILKLHSLVKPSNILDLENNLMLAKWNYIANWYNSIIACHKDGVKTVVSDRAPLEVAAYANNGHLIKDAIIQSNFELYNKFDIKLVYIYLFTDPIVMFDRMSKRKHNYNEEKYNETNFEFFIKSDEFFRKNIELWNYQVENIDLNKAVAEVRNIIQKETSQ